VPGSDFYVAGVGGGIASIVWCGNVCQPIIAYLRNYRCKAG
jgi:hypothetical protein